jgi:hypothetical protein
VRRQDLLLAGLLLVDGGVAGTRSELLVRDLAADATCQRLARGVRLEPAVPGAASGVRAVGWVHRAGTAEAPPGASVAMASEMGSGVESNPDARGTFYVTVDGKTARLTVSAPGFEPASRQLAAGTYCVEASLAASGAR